MHYLNTTDDDILDPKLLKNIKRGALMLAQHIANNDFALVQIDSDCDGLTSSALLINYLNLIFPSWVENCLKYRLHAGKEHGIILDTIPKEVKLVIAPDSSSNSYEEHSQLRERGTDVLVLDHHEADHESTDACIINNQLCDYPTKSLSGVGIVYKFCCYLDEILGINNADLFLDLVALGMIADVSDLRDFETRHLISKGLESINNPFFKTMVEEQAYSLKNEITPIGIAFYIAPYVNATIRMGTIEEKTLLFESMLDFKAYDLIPSTKRGCSGQEESRVEQACRTCSNVKNRQTKARDQLLEEIESFIEEKNLLQNKLLIIPFEKEANRNLTGLVANILMSKYQRPVLLLNKTVDEDTKEIIWEGSGRGCEKSKLIDFRGFVLKSTFSKLAEGHPQAFGAAFSNDTIDSFINYSNKELDNFDFSPCYKVDFIFNSTELNGSEIIEIANLKNYWGQGISEALIAIENINIHKDNIVLMSPDKSPTLKITLPNGVSLIKFKSSKEEYESLKTDGCITINAVGHCEKNEWNGHITPQILIEEYEIIKQQKYYF